MPIPRRFDLERAELQAVLASDVFAKSPNLAKILQYICLKYFEGQERLLKEYNIGVEALRRSPEFDPKEDSIVRVEAHRLREKLRRYYETEGANHPVVISLHAGHYVPQFLRRNEIAAQAAGRPIPDAIRKTSGSNGNDETSPGQLHQLVARHVGSPSSSPSKHSDIVPRLRWRGRRRKLLVAFALFILLISLGALAIRRSKPDTTNVILPHSVKASTSVAAEEGQGVRIIAGYSRDNYVDRMGNIWGPDRYYSGGEMFVEPQVFIARAPDSTLFQTAREGGFSYNIPLKPGTYELRLYFVETTYGPGTLRGGGEISRLFHIDLNGKRLLTDFDVFSDAGGNNIADERVFKDVSPAPDGYVHLNFAQAIDYPILSALEIVSSLPGKLQPIRIVAQDHSYTDQAGRAWSPDRYASGGRLIMHGNPVQGTLDPGLYAGERYGHFNYAIPVAEGRYSVTLRFAETYFGPQNPGKGGVGSRLFDVYCNGVALLRNFDIFKEAGGENRVLDKTFHGLQPNALGKLMLSFVPVRNYASVKAIEVVDESK